MTTSLKSFEEKLNETSTKYGTELEILYYTGEDISSENITISDTQIHGKDGFFITTSINIYLTSKENVASVIIPTSLGFLKSQEIYRELRGFVHFKKW